MPMDEKGPVGPTVEQDSEVMVAQEQEPKRAPEGPVGPNKGEDKLSAKDQAQVEAYVSGLSKMLHGGETKSHLYEMLQSGPPEQTIPSTALQVNEQMERAFKERGQNPNMNTLVAGAQFLVSDLIEIGNAGGFFQLDGQDPNVVGPLLTNTMQPYIEAKLKEDPGFAIELQNMVEPLMSEEARSQGMSIGQERGLTKEPGVSQAMKTSNHRAVMADRKSRNNEVKGVLNVG